MAWSFDPQSDRIRTAHRRLRDAYARAPGAEVPVVEPGVPNPTAGSVQACFEDLDAMEAHARGWAEALGACEENDWPPFVTTYCTVPMVPEAFGCPLHFRPDDIAPTPLPGGIELVDRLCPRPLREVSTIRRLLEWIDRAQRTLGTDLPMWTSDIQSPFSVAAQIVGTSELLMACVTDPDRVHRLCRMVTDTTRAWMDLQFDAMEHPAYPGRNFPSIGEPIGICIADDTPLVMLSPEMYREFAFPYNAELSEAYGGVHIHCCGDYKHNVDNLLDLPGIRSIQLH
ncbi:MAG: uroporphyrinogen decarboxylase family protein, partial [Planctomycetota bacterium]